VTYASNLDTHTDATGLLRGMVSSAWGTTNTTCSDLRVSQDRGRRRMNAETRAQRANPVTRAFRCKVPGGWSTVTASARQTPFFFSRGAQRTTRWYTLAQSPCFTAGQVR
jgi:hypothetical protein